MRDGVERGPAAGVTEEVEAGARALARLQIERNSRLDGGALDDARVIRCIEIAWRDWTEEASRVLQAARQATEPGADAALREEVERLTRERDEARASNRKLHRDIQQRERDFWRKARAEQRSMWLYLGHSGELSEYTRARRKFAEEIEAEQRNATAAEARADAAERDRDAARAEAFEEAAKLLAPTGQRPCNCEHCDCGNPGDHAYVVAWDEANANAAAIRALAAQTAGPAREGDAHLPSGEKADGGDCRDFRQTASETGNPASDDPSKPDRAREDSAALLTALTRLALHMRARLDGKPRLPIPLMDDQIMALYVTVSRALARPETDHG